MDDHEIVAEYLKTRDPDLFRELVERHQHKVFRVVVSVLGPAYSADAEEVTQEVFLQAHEKLGSYRAEAQLGSWLYRIAWNRAVDRRRQARFRRPPLPESVASAVPSGSNPHLEFETSQRKQELLKALEKLPEVYRTLVHLYYWLGCSLAEIQELTGVPEGTAKSYLARARKQLGEHLRDE